MVNKKEFGKQLRNASKLRAKREEIAERNLALAYDSEPSDESESLDDFAHLDTFEELSFEEAFDALNEIALFAQANEKQRAIDLNELQIIWKEFLNYLSSPLINTLDQASKKAVGQISKLRKQAGDDIESETGIVAFFVNSVLYRWNWAIPAEDQRALSKGILLVSHDRAPVSRIVNCDLPDPIKSFKVSPQDRRIVSGIRELDALIKTSATRDEREQALNGFERDFDQQFARWLTYREVDPHIEKHAFIAHMMLQEFYASYDLEARPISGLSSEESIEYAERFSALTMLTSIELFVYAPFLFRCLLEYLCDIGYMTLDQEVYEELENLQSAIVDEVINFEGRDDYLSKDKILAAEHYGYGYYNYHQHAGNLRFDVIMPRSIRLLNVALDQGMPHEVIAAKLDCSVEKAKAEVLHFKNVREMVSAGDAVASFKQGILRDFEEMAVGLDEKLKQEIIQQIFYRASDLVYLLDRNGLDIDCDCPALTGDSPDPSSEEPQT